jgi:hypothetical protein
MFTDQEDILDTYTRVNTDYGLGMTLVPMIGPCHNSDDCSFQQEGYRVIFTVEGTPNPYRHTPGDTADTLNYPTITKVLQTTAAVVATSAGIYDRGP